MEFVLENERTELFLQIFIAVFLVLGLLVVVILDPDALFNVTHNPAGNGLETIGVEPNGVIQRPTLLGLVPVDPTVGREDAVA